MKDLEKLVKESFDDFQPDVRPEVWQGLEQGLNSVVTSSAGSASQVAGSTVKGVTVKSGLWTWITGAVVTAGIGAAVLFSGDDGKSTQINNTESINTVSTIDEVQQTAIGVISPVEENSNLSAQASQNTQELNNKAATAPAEISAQKTSENRVHTSIEQATGTPSVVTTVAGNGPSSDKHNTTSTVDQKSVSKAEVKAEPELPPPPPKIIVTGGAGFAPFKVTALLNYESLNGKWDFGDGYATPLSNSASHTYNKPGVYQLQCTLKDNTVLSYEIHILGTIGTAFTPNGDGQNDEFFIEAELNELKMRIFDRSGHQEFEITQPGQRWDGKNENGKDLLPGTYFYDIFARSIDGQIINQRGTINIFR